MTEEKSAEAGQLSVVVATKVGSPFIDDCLASLEAEARALGAEVLVVACGREAEADRIRQLFPWVYVVHRSERTSVPELRRIGVERSSGQIVAVVEEHCVVDGNWLRTALAAHGRGDFGAVGGPIGDRNYRRLSDWVVYFCEYNNQLPPATAGEVAELGTANIAYRRQVLLDHLPLLGRGYWEASLHPILRAEGVRLLSVPEMIVYHRGPFEFSYYLQQRYWFSRAYAAARSKTMPLARRLVYLSTAPILPIFLLLRMGRRIWQKRHRPEKFVQALPLLVPALCVLVAGEWVGFLAGAGDALSKVE